MVVSQASETVMLFVDRLFLSRLGAVQLSAAMSGGLTTFALASFFVGVAGYVNAIVAQYYGADRKDQCARSAVQAIYLSVAFYPVLLAVIPFVPTFFSVVGHTDEQIVLESIYARFLLAGSVLIILRNAIGGFFLGIGRTRVVMVSNVVGMLVNIPVNYVLIFGKLGFPELGIRGAAIGTICGSATAFGMLLWAYFSPRYAEEYGTRRRLSFDLDIFRRLLRFGLPAGVEIFLNVAAFNAFVQLMHSYGPSVAASTTIAFNWDMVAFVPMLGMGVATTAVVGQHIGARDYEGAERTTYLALKVAYCYSGTMVLLFVFGAAPLVNVFASGFPEAGIADLAKTMVRLAGIYTLADSTQLVFAGSLRGAGDTKWVMWISASLHWIMAIGAFFLIVVWRVDPILSWVFFIAFVVSLGVSMVIRYRAGAWRRIALIEGEAADTASHGHES